MALERRTYKVDDMDGNTRLDRWCQRILGDAPNSVYQKAIRKGFVAKEGYSLLSCDYSQIELRCAAILSHDDHLLETFKKGEDSHASVASRVFSVPIDQVTKDQRRIAKVLNFGILYGMGVNALKANLQSDRKSAQEFFDAYKATFPTLMAYLEDVKIQARGCALSCLPNPSATESGVACN